MLGVPKFMYFERLKKTEQVNWLVMGQVEIALK